MENQNSQEKLQNGIGAPIEEPLGLLKVIGAIDSVSIWTGRAAAVLIFPMIFSSVWEVVARYFFNAPTIWANDMSTMLYGALFMVGSAYALQRQQHIRTDWLYDKWTTRTKGIVDSTCYIVFSRFDDFFMGGMEICPPFNHAPGTNYFQSLDAVYLAT